MSPVLVPLFPVSPVSPALSPNSQNRLEYDKRVRAQAKQMAPQE